MNNDTKQAPTPIQGEATERPVHQSVRATRDALIDVLGFGFTWPVTDQILPETDVKVAYDTPAKLSVQPSQADVAYIAHEWPDDGLPDGEEVTGNETRIFVPTDTITIDKDYKIWARKTRHADDEALSATYVTPLNNIIGVKVGLDAELPAQVLDADILDTSLEVVLPTSARIIHYHDTITVRVDNSQEGVIYRLEVDGEPENVLSDMVIGLGSAQSIELISQPLENDVDIRVRATKQFLDGGRQDETILLNSVLPVKVRANRNLSLWLDHHVSDTPPADPSVITDYRGQAVINIQGVQSTASYQLYSRLVADDEWIFDVDDMPEESWISVDVPGREEKVKVKKPPFTDIWRTAPEGFLAHGEKSWGNDQTLALPMDSLEEDSLIVVQVSKEHEEGDKIISSAVQLVMPAVALVKPDPNRALRLRFSEPSQELQVFNGQPGVFYPFNLQAGDEAISLPAYFHHWANAVRAHDKGINSLRLDVDFVVTADQDTQNPQLAVEALPTNTNVNVGAYRAMTDVHVDTPRTLSLPEAVIFSAEAQEIPQNTIARITVSNAVADASYQLLMQVGDSSNGDNFTGDITNGDITAAEIITGQSGELTLESTPLLVDTTLILRVRYPEQGGVELEYLHALAVKVVAPDEQV